MFGRDTNKALTKRGIKKMDAVVTGFILGGIVASIYGIKKHEEEIAKSINPEAVDQDGKHTFASILKMLVFGVKTLEKPVKPATLSQKISQFFR